MRVLLIKNATGFRTIGLNFALVANTFIWYFYAFSILKEVLNNIQLSYYEVLAVWAVNFSGAAISALSGAIIAEKLQRQFNFLLPWMFLGVISSLLPIFIDITTLFAVLTISLLFGVSFGFGMPSCMEYFSESTSIENRAKIGGILSFIFGLGAFFLGIMPAQSIIEKGSILSVWRILGLLIFLLLKSSQKNLKRSSGAFSYSQILTQRRFFLYFIPWCMFCLVNYSTFPIAASFFGEKFLWLSGVIEGALIGISAIAGGFLADIFGRKRVSISGFILLGLGYAILGLFSENLLSLYFYITVDGIAWGIFYTLFLFTLWGDLAYSSSSKKYYAIGGLPFLLSNFLQLIIGPYVVKTISIYTIFSLASFFLFLSVIPLMYAPETLSEKKIQDRDLKQYIEKAKKTREKYT
jgi:MFS family permease